MNIVFRVDSATTIGVGHVMRCLTLADELRNKNMDIIFISRDHQGNVNKFIIERGYQLYELSPEAMSNGLQRDDLNINSHSNWLGVTWQEDARQVKSILTDSKPNVLIVDHYSLDYQWEDELKPYCNWLMVIDDLADRKHLCDYLLDQTTGRMEEDYHSLVPLDTTLLLGTNYALLRPEFSHWRTYSLERRENPQIDKILITFGGVDADNLTGTVLRILNQCIFKNEVEIIIIMGDGAPHMADVRETASRSRHKINTLINVQNMAEIMAECDLCIGAAGSTSWERCCLGLPSLIIVIADNQKNIAMNLQEKNSAVLIKLPLEENLLSEIENMGISKMKRLSHNSSHLVDGLGTKRVVDSIIEL